MTDELANMREWPNPIAPSYYVHTFGPLDVPGSDKVEGAGESDPYRG